MTRTDYTNSIVVGEIIAIFFLVLLFTLQSELPKSIIEFFNFKWIALLLIPVIGIIYIYFIILISRKYFVVSQFGKYCYVGSSNLLIDFGTLNLLIYYTGYDSGIYYSVFKGSSFLFAVVNSYLWNKFWTFKNGYEKRMLKQFMKFLLVIGIGMLINVTIASIIVNKIEPPGSISTKLWANVGAIVSLVFTFSWNFLSMKFLVFTNSKQI